MPGLLLTLAVALGGGWVPMSTVDSVDDPRIEAIIHDLMAGIDRQDGPAIAATFAEDAVLFATNPEGNGVVVVSAADFANLHASGRFGGQERDVTIHLLDVTDALVANAKVTATNASVHYTYYVGLFYVDGEWRIHTLLQRSRRPSRSGAEAPWVFWRLARSS